MEKAMKAALVIVMILVMGATVCPIKADAATKKNINKKQAKAIALKSVGTKASKIKISKFKASIVKSGTCKYRYRDHEGTYQVKFRKGNRIYEYEILAPNGKLKEIEYKYVGKAKK